MNAYYDIIEDYLNGTGYDYIDHDELLPLIRQVDPTATLEDVASAVDSYLDMQSGEESNTIGDIEDEFNDISLEGFEDDEIFDRLSTKHGLTKDELRKSMESAKLVKRMDKMIERLTALKKAVQQKITS